MTEQQNRSGRDLFISYAHQGDHSSREAVTALVAQLRAALEADFQKRFGRKLDIFFDKEDIQSFDQWQVRCHRALSESKFFIVCLSRSYLRSDACRWEWEEWCKHEVAHGMVGHGAASLWFIKLEDLDSDEDRELLRRWQGELFRRFHIECHEWRQDDPKAILEAVERGELKQLTDHVAKGLEDLAKKRSGQGNLPWPNTNFVGREAELGRLQKALLDAPGRGTCGLHGVGGMGKTALAFAFAYKKTDAFPGGCWLLRCEGRDKLQGVFRDLVFDLGIELTEEEKKDEAAAVRRVFALLRSRGTTLFLLDNVDRLELLAKVQVKLLADQPWARLLYTTRLAPDEFTRAGGDVNPIDLDRLPDDQAVDLIRRYQFGQTFISPEHETASREIVRELSGLTLAVETAAVYLGQSDPRIAGPKYAVNVRDYLRTLREDLKTGGRGDSMSQLREVNATLRPTLARLDAPTRTILQIASLLAPDGVALPWVRAIAGQSHPELATEAATGQSDPWTQLIRSLIGMRLFQPTPEPRVVAIHRILQRVLEDAVRGGREQTAKRLEEHINERDAILNKTTQWTEARWEIEPLDALAIQWADANHEESPWLLNQTGQRWMSLAEWKRAELLMRRALAIGEKSYGPEHPNVAIGLNNLAHMLKVTNRRAEAEPLMRRALAIDEKSYGPEHPDVAKSLNNLALLLKATNRLAEAEPLMRRGLVIEEKNRGEDHPFVAIHLNNLANLLLNMNRQGEAEPLMRRALAIDEKSYGPEHPDVAIHLNNLANLLIASNRLGEAEPLLRRALAIDEKSYGPEHPDVAITLNNLAQLLKATNRLAEAEPLMRRALAIDEKSYGPEHPDVARVLHHLAQLLATTNRLAEAETLMRRSCVIFKASLGFQHPNSKTVLKNYATLLQKMGLDREEILSEVREIEPEFFR